MKIVSDIHGLDGVAPAGIGVRVIAAETVPSRWRRAAALLWSARSADYLVIHFSLYELLLFTTLLALLPGSRCRVVTLDFFVVNPSSALLPWIRWSFRRCATMLVYFKNTAAIATRFGIPSTKLRFIPFKVNSWDLVRGTIPVEESFVFVGGRSRRDFATLFAAVRDLEIPVKVLTAREAELTPHGSSLAGLEIPKNVEILWNDSDSSFFVELLSRARLVVLPIRKDAAIQAGIGVCLLAMALRKCVLISEALGVTDVLSDQEIVPLPAGDVAALRDAIERYWNDDDARRRIANAAQRHAWGLGGADQLRSNILKAVMEVDRNEH
jgi:glycosyltransferase involved in cell wall biosynthesis